MSSDAKKKLGERVKRARLEANLKQSELADQLGISQGVISNVETGVSTIDVPDLPRWAAALNKPILYFYLDAQMPLREQAEAILSLFPEERLEMVLHMLQQLALSLHTETPTTTSSETH
jgi:transcriptional regulator with XRE-family HTH domain